jgi:hypothetical protein
MYPNLNLIPLLGKNVNPNLSDDDKIKKGKAPACGKGWSEEENFEANNQLVRVRKAPMYGVLTGIHNNLFVVDYDIYKSDYNPEHNINLKTLKAKHGAGAYIVQTQRGGFHVYHKYEDKFEDWGGTTGVHGYIDSRNTGNFIVGGKSTGYKELSGTLENLTEMPLEPFGWLDGRIQEKRANSKKQTTAKKQPKTMKEQSEESINILKSLGFKDVVLTSKYGDLQIFVCNREEKCPCCKRHHTSQEWFYKIEKTGGFKVKNYSENCRDVTIRKYEMVKMLFEMQVCRLNDKLNYAVRDGDDLNLYQKGGILERFSHLKYEEAVEVGVGETKTLMVVKTFIFR